MEPTQILLFAVVTILTILLLVVGIQVFFILRDTKKTLDKINKVLDDAGLVSGSVAKPIFGFANFVEGLKNIKNLADFVSSKTVQDEKILEEPHSHIQSLQERGRRFFHKDGKTLTS